MQLAYEKDKLAQKMLKVKEFEDDLKKKINEFEEIFRAISEVQSDLHLSEKKQYLLTYLQNQKKQRHLNGNGQRSASYEMDLMYLEDTRSRLVQDSEDYKQRLEIK